MTFTNDIEHHQVKQVAAQKTAGDLIIAYLEMLEVEYIFGIPGGAIEPFYNAIARARQRGVIKPIVARHECGAAFMAEGYYYHSGKLGVCCATTGPGITNMITGIASAYANYIPMLVISAQTSLATFGKNAVQESSCTSIDINAMLKHCCRYSTLVSHPEQLERKLTTAIMAAFKPTPGPVHISVPMDIMHSAAPVQRPGFDLNNLIQTPINPPQSSFDAVYKELIQSKKCVFIIGDGCNRGVSDIMMVANLLNISVVSTHNGKGLVNPYHPLYKGVIGFAGHDDAMDTVADAEVDTIVCLGTMMGQFATNSWDPRILPPNKIIHIDEHEMNFYTTPMARLQVHCSIFELFSQLVNRLIKERPAVKGINQKQKNLRQHKLHFQLENEAAYKSSDYPIKPQRLMKELPKIFPENTRYLADIGNSFAWAVHYLHPYDRRLYGSRQTREGLLRTGLEFYVMGWAIGCAIGTSLALKGQPIACITGDGSVLMAGQELSVAVQEKLPIAFIVLNDSALGMVKHGQRLTGAEKIGYEIANTDFVTLAQSMGARGYRVESVNDLKLLSSIAKDLKRGPVVVDIIIDPEEVPPIGRRIEMLKGS